MPSVIPKSFFFLRDCTSPRFQRPARIRSPGAAGGGLQGCSSILERRSPTTLPESLFSLPCQQRRSLRRQRWAPCYCWCFLWRGTGEISPAPMTSCCGPEQLSASTTTFARPTQSCHSGRDGLIVLGHTPITNTWKKGRKTSELGASSKGTGLAGGNSAGMWP